MGTNDAQIHYKMSACYGVNLLVGGKNHKDSNLYKEMGWWKSPDASRLQKKVGEMETENDAQDQTRSNLRSSTSQQSLQ